MNPDQHLLSIITLMKRFLKWLGIGCLVLVLLFFVALPVCAQLGMVGWFARVVSNLAWKQTESLLRSKGEKLTFEELVAPPPEDAANFFAAPLWLELFYSGRPKEQWQINQWKVPLTGEETDRLMAILPERKSPPEDRAKALMALKKSLGESSDPKSSSAVAKLTLDLAEPATPILGMIAELSKRPGASLPIRYQDGFAAAMPHLTPILGLGQVLGARCHANLALGDSPNAAADIAGLLALQKSLENEPVMVPFLVRQALITIALEAINRGISLHGWSETQLFGFEQNLREIQLQRNLAICLRGERACVNTLLRNPNQTIVEGSRKLPGRSILPLQVAVFNRIMQHTLDNLEQPPGKPWNSSVPVFPEIQALKQSPRWIQAVNLLALLCLPALDVSVIKAAQGQTQVNQTIIACALERYRIGQGSYPSSLDALVPGYLASLPTAPTTGKPMHYRLQPDGIFLLWAQAWNLKTLDGQPGEFRGEGDVVWNQALPMKRKP